MLGRAMMERLAAENDVEAVGLCHSRSGAGLVRVDLTDAAATDAMLESIAPDAIIHTAAVRRPDEFAADEPAAWRLNVDATSRLAGWAASRPGKFLVYISSDYAFDGTRPPYVPDSPTHPINGYGASKVEGEKVVRDVLADRSAILRVPILYGDVETLDESSVTTVVAAVLDAKAQGRASPLVLDDWAVRYPTHVADVADVIAQIVSRRIAGTFHWSGPEPLTKRDMGVLTARAVGFDENLIAGSGAPANGSEPRPKDCHLDRSALEALGVSAADRTFQQTLEGNLLPRFGKGL